MQINLGPKTVGDGQPCFIVAEIGINHNGDLEIARALIDKAVKAGCDAVKFQKRTVDIVYSPDELARPRDNPFGSTNGDLKRGLEFGLEEYEEIDRYCKKADILWTASCWDEASVDFIEQFDPPFYKIASASLTDDNLLKHHRAYGHPLVLSTGMSSIEQIQHAVDLLGHENLVVMHCTSTYPSTLDELNLSMIPVLKKMLKCPIGYSGHEVGLPTTLAAAAIGADIIERHVTLDRAMWGSDQAASIEPSGLDRLVRDIRAIEQAMGDGVKRVYDSEIPIREKLRRI